MPVPVSMFKTDDGRIFDSLADAVAHEQKTFFSAGLTPLLSKLLTGVSEANPAIGPVDIEFFASGMVDILAADRSLIQEFQKLFSKLQLVPVTPVAKKRARAAKKKPEAPAVPEAPTVPDAEGPPPFKPDAIAPEVTPEYLAELDSLAGNPIQIPPMEEQAPPPPLA